MTEPSRQPEPPATEYPEPPDPWPLNSMRMEDSDGEWIVIHQPSRDDEYLRTEAGGEVDLEDMR